MFIGTQIMYPLLETTPTNPPLGANHLTTRPVQYPPPEAREARQAHWEVLVARNCLVPYLHSQSEQIQLVGVIVLEVVGRLVDVGALGEIAQVESEVRVVSARGVECGTDFQGGL